MGFTYSPQDAIDYVKKHIKDIPVTSLDAEACDTVSSIMYVEAYWRWTIQNIPPASIPLVNGVQDYSVPTNLYRLIRARIVQTNVTPNLYNDNTSVREWIPPNLNELGFWGHRGIAHEESLGKLRLEGAASVTGSDTFEIQGEYQINPTKITDANLTSGFWFPDQYFPVFCEGLKWKLYEYADDSRAGNVSIDKFGRRTTTGQAGKFYFALDVMKQAEDKGTGQSTEFPDDPLGVGGGGGFGIYGAY